MAIPLTVVTYNLHSCVGTDGLRSPARIADVLASVSPDVIGLQELDSGMFRSGMSDQAGEIAERLRMTHRFHPSFNVGEGGYGNAVLSRFPIRLRKAAVLPRPPGMEGAEPRGALWVSVVLGTATVNVFVTHLGLKRKERELQAAELVSPQWLLHPERIGPTILCGDFNAFPRSSVYRKLTTTLRDSQTVGGFRPAATWPSRKPVFSLDYILISPDILVKGTEVAAGGAASAASDHLPVVARLLIQGAS